MFLAYRDKHAIGLSDGSRESVAIVDCPPKLRMLRQVLGSSNILALLSAIPIILAAGDTGGLEYGALSGHGSHIEGSVPAVPFRGKLVPSAYAYGASREVLCSPTN